MFSCLNRVRASYLAHAGGVVCTPIAIAHSLRGRPLLLSINHKGSRGFLYWMSEEKLARDARGKFFVPKSVLSGHVTLEPDSRTPEQISAVMAAHSLVVDVSGTLESLHAWSAGVVADPKDSTARQVFYHHGQSLCCPTPEVDPSGQYRGVYANQPLAQWTLLLSVPLSCLLHDGLVGGFQQLAAKYGKSTEVPTTACLAWFLMTEHVNHDSEDASGGKWKGFIDSMPADMSHMPLKWQTKHLRELRGSFVRKDLKQQRTLNRKAFEAMKAAWEADVAACADKKDAVLVGRDLTKYSLEEFTYYASLVSSRHFLLGLQSATTNNKSLAPFGDMYNHNEQLENVAFAYDPNHQCFVFFTTSEVAEGQELFVSYGPRDNGYLLTGYGFAIPQNEDFNRCMLSYEYDDVVHNFKIRKAHDERQSLKCLSLLRLIFAPDPAGLAIGWLLDDDGNPPADQKMDGYDVERMCVQPSNPFNEYQVLHAVLQGCDASLGEFETAGVEMDAKILAEVSAAAPGVEPVPDLVPSAPCSSTSTPSESATSSSSSSSSSGALDFRVQCAVQMRLGEKQVLHHWKALCEDMVARWKRVEDDINEPEYQWSAFARDTAAKYVHPETSQGVDPQHRAYVQQVWGPWLSQNPNNE